MKTNIKKAIDKLEKIRVCGFIDTGIRNTAEDMMKVLNTLLLHIEWDTEDINEIYKMFNTTFNVIKRINNQIGLYEPIQKMLEESVDTLWLVKHEFYQEMEYISNGYDMNKIEIIKKVSKKFEPPKEMFDYTDNYESAIKELVKELGLDKTKLNWKEYVIQYDLETDLKWENYEEDSYRTYGNVEDYECFDNFAGFEVWILKKMLKLTQD